MFEHLYRYTPHVLAGIVVGASVALLFLDNPLEYLGIFIGENMLVSALIFVLMLVFATVFAPVTVLPLIPPAAVLLGPFLTGVLSIAGWTVGAVIAFLIARHAGRPLLERFVSFERLARYEALMPTDAQFLTILVLRMLVPVDVLSYALGIFSTVSLRTYTVATALGVSWFSFVFAYMGTAAHAGSGPVLFVLGGVSLAVLLIGWYAIVRRARYGSEREE